MVYLHLSLKQHLAKYQKFFTLFFSTLHQTSCDKVGRTSIPPILKEAVKVKKEIVVAGVLNKIELWPKEVYDLNLANLMGDTSNQNELAQMTEEAFALLGDEKPSEPKEPLQETLARVMDQKLTERV